MPWFRTHRRIARVLRSQKMERSLRCRSALFRDRPKLLSEAIRFTGIKTSWVSRQRPASKIAEERSSHRENLDTTSVLIIASAEIAVSLHRLDPGIAAKDLQAIRSRILQR